MKPNTCAFTFTPSSTVQRVLASFAFRKDDFVTIRLADSRLYFEAEAAGCILCTSQPVDCCTPGDQTSFSIEARIAVKLHTLFPHAVQATYCDDTFCVLHDNSTICMRAWQLTKSSTPPSTDEIVRQAIDTKKLKWALEFVLPFAKPNRIRREDSDLHFQGNAIVAGKDSWAAAIVTFANSITSRDFSLTSSAAAQLQSILPHMSSSAEMCVGSESIQFTDNNTTISFPPGHRKYPPAETLLRRVPTSKHFLKATEFIKSLACHSVLLRPSHTKDTATMSLKYDPARSTVLSIKVKNNIVPSLSSAGILSATGNSDSSNWSARVDLAGLLTVALLDDATPVSLAPMDAPAALYVGQAGSDIHAHAFFIDPAPANSYARTT